jgi:O-antigen/teichoic acid export membrane protein
VNLALQRVDVVAVGLLTSSTALTAAYAVARESVTALSKIRQGFDQVLAPVAAELHAGSHHAELAASAAAAARWGLVVAAPLALVFAVFPDAVLGVLGVTSAPAAAALAVLSIGRLVDVATGPTSVLLGMVGWPRLVLLDVVVGLVVAVAGQALLGPVFGLIGIAAATTAGVVVVNLLALYWLHSLENLRPVTRDLVRPVTAAAIAGAALVIARVAVGVPAPLPLAIGLAVWAAGYLGLALSLGLLPSAWNPFRRPAAEVT